MCVNSLLYEKKLELELIYAALWPITRNKPKNASTHYASFSGSGNCKGSSPNDG